MKNTLLIIALLVAISHANAEPKPAPADKSAQPFKQGQYLLAQGQTDDALDLFRQAAATGEPEGAFAAGKILLDQAEKVAGLNRIQLTHEGLNLLFQAATNRHPAACAALSRASLQGLGLKPSREAAYAWLILAVHFNPDFKPALDQMVIHLEPKSVTRAQALAAQWLQGGWPAEDFKPVERGDDRLKIQGIAVCSQKRLVVLNGKSFSANETDHVSPANLQKSPKTPQISITCLEVGDDYALVSVTGDKCLRLLSSD